MVQGYTLQNSSCPGGCFSFKSRRFCCGSGVFNFSPALGWPPYPGGYSYEQRHAHPAAQPKLRWSEGPGREVGGFMLSISGLNRFYYLRDFHDMRCKYDRVLSIIHQ